MIETITPTQNAQTDAPTCPVCLASEHKEWGMRTEQLMYECQSCGVVFFDRRKFELHEYENYYDYTDDWDASRVAWELKIRRRALRKQLAQLGSYVEGRKLLDIGAGPGYLCRIAMDEGWDASGIELSAKALRIGRQFLGVNYVQADDVPEESLDVITCHHVLEHMEQPRDFIESLRSKLKTGGVIAVHVPHREPLSFLMRNKLDALRKRDAEKLCALYVPEHISGFTPQSLARTFELFGFQPLMLKTRAMWSMYYDPFFLKNYLREKKYVNIFKHALRSLIDNAGVLANRGDWVVAHFRKN